ncbi:Hypothetical predicted protein [Paramuricea clavata]|uniref:Uncharacterized protein n=1 Tax=Paramuricea clavata TaxID=317549 RepID=A0A7D9J1Y1_PARCT|nr:Hypothetical predicted protein [Paramuricea clavata]
MLMNKLPNQNLKRWADKAGDFVISRGQVKFGDFVDFVEISLISMRLEILSAGDRLSNVFGDEPNSSMSQKRQDETKRRYLNRSKGDEIRTFANQEKLKVVSEKKLCKRCLEGAHFTRSCKRRFICRKKDCGQEHHDLMHPPETESKEEAKEDYDVKISAGNLSASITRKCDETYQCNG